MAVERLSSGQLGVELLTFFAVHFLPVLQIIPRPEMPSLIIHLVHDVGMNVIV